MSAKLVIELPRADRDWVDHKSRKGRIPAGAGARNGCFIRTLLLIVPDIRKIVWDAKSYWTAGRRLLFGRPFRSMQIRPQTLHGAFTIHSRIGNPPFDANRIWKQCTPPIRSCQSGYSSIQSLATPEEDS